MDSDKFTDEEFEQVESWVLLTQSMIGVSPEMYREVLKGAVCEIAAKCNARWPLGRGEHFAVGADELDADFGVFTEDVSVAWVGRTALCLFAGMDGPNLTADVLCEGIDELTDDIERRTGV